MKTTDTQKNAGMVARFDNREAKGDCSPVPCSPIGSATRKANGWYPVLEYPNGGRFIGDILCCSMEQAKFEAWEMVECMENHPGAFTSNHPQPNQLIDLRENVKGMARRPNDYRSQELESGLRKIERSRRKGDVSMEIILQAFKGVTESLIVPVRKAWFEFCKMLKGGSRPLDPAKSKMPSIVFVNDKSSESHSDEANDKKQPPPCECGDELLEKVKNRVEHRILLQND